MNPRARSLPLATLEGLLGGAAAGLVLKLLELSPTYNVFTDVLNSTFRNLGRYLSEETVIRLDVESVAVAAYVGGTALAGAALGALLGAARRAGWGPGPTGRAVLLAGLLGAMWTVVLGAVWQHRGLSWVVGGSLVLLAAAAGGATARLAGAGLSRAFSVRALAVAAGLAPAIVAMVGAGTLIVARRGPAAPPGETVVRSARTDTGLKVAILAVDGLDWPSVDRAVAEGRLPHLTRLIAEGTRGNLRSIRPPKSPVVWTSAVTGVLPSVHGIRDFVERREGQQIPVTGNLRRVPALWNLAERCGFTAAFTNWYVSWPAEPVAGVIVSDRVDYPGLPQRVFPESLTAAVDSARARVDERPDRDVARFTALGEDFGRWRADQWGQVRRAIQVLDDVVRHDLVTIETARVALRDGQPDLTALYFRGNDNTQHLFWKYRFTEETPGPLPGLIWSRPDDAEVDALSPVVDRYYDFADRMIGETLEMLEPGTVVLVLSDHGFLTNNERSRMHHANRILETAGFTALVPGSGGEAVPESSRVFDPLPPTVDPVRKLRAGGRATDAGQDLAAARDALESVRTDDGAPVFASLQLGTDEEGPYLRTEFAVDPAGERARVGDRELQLDDFYVPEGHSGNHRMSGFLLAVGEPFAAGAQVEGMRALDVAPTVLHLLGAPAARDMEGIVFTDLFTPEWRDAHPVRYIPTYGDRKVEGGAISTEADARIREELEALGYLQGS